MSDLGISKDAVTGAMAAIREGKPDLLAQYREAHHKAGCRIVRYMPDQDGWIPITSDARCHICKLVDEQVSAAS